MYKINVVINGNLWFNNYEFDYLLNKMVVIYLYCICNCVILLGVV